MLIRLGFARFSILLGCFLVSGAPACGGRTGDDLESGFGAGGSPGTGDTSGGGAGQTASGGANRGGDGGTSGGAATCDNPGCQDCRDCVSACTCAGNDYQYCANACNGAAGAPASGGKGGKGGQGGQGGQGGISAVGGAAGSQSCDAGCPSVVIPTVGNSLSGCCLPDESCGVDTDFVAGFVAVEGGCQSYNQVGSFNGQCPAASSPVGAPLEGCCRADGTCGNDLSVLGLGCVRATASGGSVNRCDPFVTTGTGGTSGTGGVGTGGTAGAAGAISAGGGPSVEECLNNAQSDCERCACKSCNASLDPCFKDAGCPLILQCANETKCSGTDCYQPSTCQSVIDEFGGLSSVSLNLAAPLFQCVRGCGCGFASP